MKPHTAETVEKADPFLITGPALISFSGGRTSAYMLWRILRAHDWKLPDDVVVVFFNTGKEREETLRFVHTCQSRWAVPVVWAEWRDNDAGFEEVGFNSASRSGEPFAALIAKKGYLPNRGAGYCSIELKARVGRDYCRTRGWKNWNSVIGLRADELDRVHGALRRNDSKRDPWRNVMPLHSAGIARRDVLAFWREQAFDLGLMDYEGNCDLCWKKSRTKLKRIIRDNPIRALWWKAQEASVSQDQTASTFNLDYSVMDLVREVRENPTFPDLELEQDHDAACDLLCEPDAE